MWLRCWGPSVSRPSYHQDSPTPAAEPASRHCAGLGRLERLLLCEGSSRRDFKLAGRHRVAWGANQEGAAHRSQARRATSGSLGGANARKGWRPVPKPARRHRVAWGAIPNLLLLYSSRGWSSRTLNRHAVRPHHHRLQRLCGGRNPYTRRKTDRAGAWPEKWLAPRIRIWATRIWRSDCWRGGWSSSGDWTSARLTVTRVKVALEWSL